MVVSAIRDFLKLETAGGMLLIGAAVVAMGVANSPLATQYASLIGLPVVVSVGTFEIAKPLLLWINDGLMALFFLLVGLELKREFLEGELSDRSQLILPGLCAVGGMVVPASFYVYLNFDNAIALQGWAIPAATDIAFALAILAMLGNRVPLSLRVLLVSIAIFDDVGAIVIIALFYTDSLVPNGLLVALACLPLLWLMNRRGVLEKAPYLLIGLVMWVAVLKSGVHATLAGVVLAFFIPIRDSKVSASPLHELEHDLHTAVAFFILPAFAFANAGISFTGVSLESMLHPVPLGILLGLFFGKQAGVFGFAWLGIKLGFAKLPEGTSWSSLYGVSMLCGVGFTMSLFIGSLAFEYTDTAALFDERLGIIAGSVLSAVGGYLVLRWSLGGRVDSAAQDS